MKDRLRIFGGSLGLLGLLLAGQCGPDASTLVPPGNGAGTLLATLPLGDNPNILHIRTIVLDVGRGRAYVDDNKRIRRIDLASRRFLPLSFPDGVFYCIDPQDDLIGQINPATGLITRMFASPRFNINSMLVAGTPFGMTYNPTSKTLFVIDVGGGGRRPALFEIDPQTGEYSQIGETGLGNPTAGPGVGMDGATCLARDPTSGLLYTVDFGPVDHLWWIDPTTGTAGAVGSEFIGSTDIQGLSFSPDGVLYGLSPGRNVSSAIARIDLTTGVASFVGSVGLLVPYGLAFKPDGTLWTVELLYDVLTEIDPATGGVLREFPTLKIKRGFPFLDGYHFDSVQGLTFAPEGGADATVPSTRSIESVGVDVDGGVLAAAGDSIFEFDSDMALRGGGVAVGGLKTFRSVVTHPNSGLVYVRDGLAGTVYEIDPNDLSLKREIKYVEVPAGGGGYATPRPPEMQIDPTTGHLYLVHSSAIYAIDLGAGTSEQRAFDGDAQGLIVDAARRRLHINTLLGGTTADGQSNCSTIRTFNLDTLETLGEVCVGVQIFGMAFDAKRNRIAANARFAIPTFDTRVFLFDMATFSPIPYDLVIPSSEGTDAAFYAGIAIDADRNQLLVAIGGDNPRVEFHQLP